MQFLFLMFALLNPAGRAQPPAAPRWLRVGGEIRGRGEMFTGLNYVPGNDDGYYLHRLRLNADIEARPWLRFSAQLQDSQAPAYRRPVPSNVANTFDLRLAYVEFGAAREGWALRFGRQEFSFGEERLVGAANWGNTGRAFDGFRLSYKTASARLDWFATSPVVPLNGGFDRPRTNNKFHGFHGSIEDLVPQSTLEPFFFIKTNTQVRGELGDLGDLDVYTPGLRWVGKLPYRFDYNVEMAFQWGHAAGDGIRAWAGHWLLGYSPWKHERAPRLVTEYNFGSGDPNPSDGRRQTFDQLFPTNHGKYGTTDRLSWRNMRSAMAGLEWKPDPAWRVNLEYHSFWLADRRDALYSEPGVALFRNPAASTSRVGSEINLLAFWRVSSHIRLAAGFSHFFPGRFLTESGRATGVTAPYGMWSYFF
jgi:hypothetical protein